VSGLQTFLPNKWPFFLSRGISILPPVEISLDLLLCPTFVPFFFFWNVMHIYAGVMDRWYSILLSLSCWFDTDDFGWLNVRWSRSSCMWSFLFTSSIQPVIWTPVQLRVYHSIGIAGHGLLPLDSVATTGLRLPQLSPFCGLGCFIKDTKAPSSQKNLTFQKFECIHAWHYGSTTAHTVVQCCCWRLSNSFHKVWVTGHHFNYYFTYLTSSLLPLLAFPTCWTFEFQVQLRWFM